MPKKTVDMPISIINPPKTEADWARWISKCTAATAKAIESHVKFVDDGLQVTKSNSFKMSKIS